MTFRLCSQLTLLAAISLLSSPVRAITFGQFDDFQDGTLQGWTGGSSPTNQPTGGPSGDGDRYMQLTTGGSPSNLGAFNDAQWAGDYAAAGVTRVVMHLRNSGPDPVSVRIMIATPGCPAQTSCTAWTSTIATVLPVDPNWAMVEFSLAESDLTRVAGSLSYASSINNVQRFHFRHDDGAPSPPGTASLVDAVLGVDNIVALPEASRTNGVLAGTALLIALFPRGNRRKRGNRVPMEWYGFSLVARAAHRALIQRPQSDQ